MHWHLLCMLLIFTCVLPTALLDPYITHTMTGKASISLLSFFISSDAEAGRIQFDTQNIDISVVWIEFGSRHTQVFSFIKKILLECFFLCVCVVTMLLLANMSSTTVS